jgi:hypothetical protein
MPFDQSFVPSIGGVLVAAAAVVAGAPLFSRGLRVLRLRRALRGLRDSTIAEMPEGLVRIKGRVGLESPLFAPLSGKRCAGYRIEAHAPNISVAQTAQELRPFRLVADGLSAHVAAEQGDWAMPVTAELEVGPDDPLPGLVARHLDRMPEALWVRRTGRDLKLVERSLLSGMRCSVMARATRARSAELAHIESIEWQRTGTDDEPIPVASSIVGRADVPVVHLGADDSAGPPRVSDGDIDAAADSVPIHRAIGVVLGPALSLLGMLYLAFAADYWRALRMFSG